MTIRIRNFKPHAPVEIIGILPDFIFDGRRKARVKIRFQDGFKEEWLVENLEEDTEGEIAKAMEKIRNG